MTLALLRAAKNEVRSQSMESRSVRRSPRLAWDTLVGLYGDEKTLKERIKALKAEDLADDKDLLELADKYGGGWRPEEFS